MLHPLYQPQILSFMALFSISYLCFACWLEGFFFPPCIYKLLVYSNSSGDLAEFIFLLGLFCFSGLSGYSFCLWHSSCLNFKRKLRTSSISLILWIFCFPDFMTSFSYLLTSFWITSSGTSWKEWMKAKYRACLLHYTEFFNDLTGKKIFVANLKFLRILIFLLYCLLSLLRDVISILDLVVSAFIFKGKF